MTGLLALVADFLATGRFLRAVTGVVARLATVVALHAVDTFSGHVAEAAARVAGFASTTTVAATERAAIGTASLRAVSGNVTSLATLVALSCLATSSSTASERAFTGNVSSLSTFVAGLVVLHRL